MNLDLTLSKHLIENSGRFSHSSHVMSGSIICHSFLILALEFILQKDRNCCN